MKSNSLLFLFSLCLLTACKEKSVEVVPGEPAFVYTTSRCVSTGLAKRTLQYPDSVCLCSFSDKLIMDFSVSGNCCPDSNRFVLFNEIRNDTILITVADTAQNLCRCICLYMIHSEISDLPLDQYVVRCRMKNGENYVDPVHLFTAIRK